MGSVDVGAPPLEQIVEGAIERDVCGPARGAVQFVGGPHDDGHVDGTDTRGVDDHLNRHTTARDEPVDQVMDRPLDGPSRR